MTIENKGKPEPKEEDKTTSQDEEVEESEKETETESVEDESSLQTEEDKEIDYKAIAEAERERAKKAEDALAFNRYNASKKKREEPIQDEVVSDDEDDKPLTKKDLAILLQRERENTRKSLEESVALNIARKNTQSEDEAQAVITYWKNRVIPTGNVEEDIIFAIGGLNSRKLLARNEELMRAAKNRDGVISDSSITHREAMTGSIPKVSAQQSASLKRTGFVYDPKSKVWKKKLKDGYLIKDPRTPGTSFRPN